MIFVDDDKMYSFYGMRLKIITGDTPDISTTNISDIGNLITPTEFYNNDGIELYFVIGWNLQMTGFGEGNASSGPKQNWNVEFLDLNNGNSLYDAIVKTDSNGSFYIPQHAINAEVFEISVTCIDSSGFDTLTGEQSEIGENFTAIGTSETGLIAQATPLSSVLAEGFKESANLNLTSYKNLKSSYESAFGISDININPYDTEVDDTNASINSSKILEIEALSDGMRTILSENSSMSRSNIQKKVRKAISQKLTSPNIDFTNTTIISDMIQTAATEVVDNGTNIVTLRNKATGLSSSVNYIKTTFHSHSSSNRNTRLFELHKSLTSVKNTFKASPNFNTNITSSITNHRNILNVSKFNVPSRSLWKRKWDVRFVSNPPVFINQDATYTYTPIAKGSVQQYTPIIVIFKPSWLNWNGKTLYGTPDNSRVGSHSVILKSIEGNREKNQTFSITVNNINDTPTFTNSPPAIIDIANQPTYSYTPTVNDIDVGDSLTIISVTDLTNSWLTWDGTTLQGSPNYSQIGTYPIHLRVSDNGLPQRSGNIHFTIQVFSTNIPPTFTSNPSSIIDEDSEYNYTPTVSDINLNDTLNFSVPTKPSWLNWNGTKLNGIPTNDDIGNHNVIIRVNDGTINVDQSFTITVNAVNDAPIFTSNPPAIVDEDTLYTYTPTASDEEGDSVTFSLHSSNAKGPAWLNWDGTTLSGTPTNDNIGNTTVTIRASDGAINIDQSFTITVNAVNDAPIFTSNPPAIVDEDTLYTYTPTASDEEGDSVTFSLHSSNAKGPAWLNWDGTTLSGTPTNDNIGNTTVTIRASDGAIHVDQSFTITVNAVNDAPIFTSNPPAIVDEDTLYTYTPTASDEEGDSVTFSLHSSNAKGPAWLNWDGTTLSGTPTNDNIGNTTVTIRASDGAINIDQSFTITVNAVNDAPIFTSNPPAIVDEDTLYTYTPTASDEEGDSVTFSLHSSNAKGPAWLNWDGTTLSGTPTNDNIGNTTVTIRASDGNSHVDQSFIITVNAVNDAPIFTSNPPSIVDEDTLYTYTPTASDEEGDSLTFSLHSSNAKGPAWLNWDGTTLSGTPTNDNIGNTTVTIRASDGAIHVDQSFTITVNNVNDAPVFTTIPNATIYTDEDSLYTYTPTAIDEDGDSVTFSLHSSNETGPAWLNWDGTTLSGTPTNDNVGNTNVTIRASDGAIHVDQSFTITVNNVNDPPVFTNTPSNSVIDNTTYSYTPTAIDVDLNYSLSFSIVTKPNFLTWNGTTLSGVPSNNTGVHNIIIRVTDGIVNVDQTFTLEVNRYIFETRTSLVTAVNAWTTNSTTASSNLWSYK